MRSHDILPLLLLYGFITHRECKIEPAEANVCSTHNSESGAAYDITPLCEKAIEVSLSQPKDSKIVIDLAKKSVACGDVGLTNACIYVPGLNPTSIGTLLSIRESAENIPSAGVSISISGGSTCEAMKHKNRTATISIQCPGSYKSHTADDVAYKEVTAREGISPHLCEYYITIISNVGCPLHREQEVKVTAVTGCKDSHSASHTQSCSALGGSNLIVHGTGFLNLQSHVTEIGIGQLATCDKVKVVNDWSIECVTRVQSAVSVGSGHSYKLSIVLAGWNDLDIYIYKHVSVSFTAVPDFEQLFTNLQTYGVGGMRRQGKEIYDRVFLTRTIPSHITRDLGLTHIKGLILYGPPGTGKSLLARTIASVIDSKHVHMVSSPELLNKYVGESERNLRVLFAQAEQDWQELQHNSPLHVIILDEIDAICKPRGRDMNNIGSLVYDSLVNQLLTKLDGLRQLDNLLVIGLTNRFELMDPALLRPGRFEVTIEMTLPDMDERREILSTHLSAATASGRLAADFNLEKLARVTAGSTPAQLAGMVRQAQRSALSRAQLSGSIESVTISAVDFDESLTLLASHSKYNLSREACAAYSNVHNVMNGTLPKSALIQVERYNIITPCLRFLLEEQGFYVKVFEPKDVLMDPHIPQNLHNIATSVRFSKVAVILVDICYMLHTCAAESYTDRVHPFLMSLRSFTNSEDGNSLLVGICMSHCHVEVLKPHFSYLFGMVTTGPLSARTLDTQKKSNTTVKA